MNRLNLDEAKQNIEIFKSEIYFPSIKVNASIHDLIKDCESVNTLRGLSSEELLNMAVVLANYSLFLLTEENRLKSFRNWCESNIKYIVGQNLQNAPGYGFTEKDIYIRANDTIAQELDSQKLLIEAKLDIIHFLSQKIQNLSEILKNLAYEKNRYIKGP